jgi:hypothetical protein
VQEDVDDNSMSLSNIIKDQSETKSETKTETKDIPDEAKNTIVIGITADKYNEFITHLDVSQEPKEAINGVLLSFQIFMI